METAKLIDRGLDADEAIQDLSDLEMTVVEIGQDVAQEAARLRSVTMTAGLSIGDRFCLALAKQLGIPALTTDRAWKEIAEASGVKVELAR